MHHCNSFTCKDQAIYKYTNHAANDLEFVLNEYSIWQTVIQNILISHTYLSIFTYEIFEY